MILVGKKVKYTPEIVTVTKGKPVTGTIVGEGMNGLRIELKDGSEVLVNRHLCEIEAGSEYGFR